MLKNIYILVDLCIYVITTIPKLWKFTESFKCLTGKTAIVTGGNSGIGLAIATKLASRGCKVIIADCQNAEKTIDQIKINTGNMSIVYKYLDLSSLHSVRSFAADICKTEEKIDVLVNNAGLCLTERKMSEDGLNYSMQVNIFGAFLLTHLLIDLLKKSGSARVTFTSSIAALAHFLTPSRLNPIDLEMNYSNQISIYCNSKACNILAAQEFGKKLKKFGINVYCFDPTLVQTQIFDSEAILRSVLHRIILKILFFILKQDPREVANSYFHVITNDDTKTGENYVLSSVGKKPKILEDSQFCEAIWRKMETLVKLEPEEKI